MASVNGNTSRKPSGSSTRSSGQSPSPSPNPAGHHRLGPSSNGMFNPSLNSGGNLKVSNNGWQYARQRQAAAAQAASLSTSQRYDGSSSPTRGANGLKGYGASASPYGMQQSSLPVTYDSIATSFGGSGEPDLSLGLKGLSVKDDYDNNTSGYRNQGQTQSTIVSGSMSMPRTQYSNYYGTSGSEAYPEYTYPYDAAYGRPAADVSMYGGGTGLPPAIPPTTTTGRGMYNPMTPAHHHAELHHHHHRSTSGVYYPDYSNHTPAGQFYYPQMQLQVPGYHHALPPQHMTPQLASATPANPSLADKKRDAQGMAYNLQAQHQQNLYLASMRGASSHSQPGGYTAGGIDYSTGLPVMPHQASMYGHHAGRNQVLHPHHAYQQHGGHGQGRGGPGGGRRSMGPESSPDSGVGLRSAMLEEFRVNKYKKWELKEISGHIVEFAGDQHGSRFIQQKLETASSEEKQAVFDEVLPDHAMPLITDVFGNYVVQKLFEHGTKVQKEQLANTMVGSIVMLSLQMYGCRVVQKAIECITPEQQTAFVKELDGSVMRCVKDANGNHVIQKMIEVVSPDRLTFVAALKGNVHELSTHPYGCRVLQRCFEHLTTDQTRPLLEELHRHTNSLMQDQFGNYVIQFVLENGTLEDRMAIVSKLQGQMVTMARHKFASNVCEKALITADSESRRVLIEEIMTPKADGVSPILVMMKDQYANYVLQRALSVVEGEQADLFVSKIRPHLIAVRRSSSAYSKHLMSIERLMIEKTTKAAAAAQPHKTAEATPTSA